MRITAQTNLRSGSGRMAAALRGKLGQVVGKAAHDIEARAKGAILGGAKSGRMYGAHQASAPGEAPAADLGVLAASISVENTGDLERKVIATAEYAAGLELGTVKTEPRPFMTPAVDAVKPIFLRAIERAVKQS